LSTYKITRIIIQIRCLHKILLSVRARKAGTTILVDGENKVKAEGVQAETLLKEGHTVQEILKAARDSEFDLIVMGARGISKIRGMLLGSVSDGVIRNAPCPVPVTK